MGTPMKGFFDGADIVAKATASTSAATQGAPTEAPIPSPKPDLVEESAQTERVDETVGFAASINLSKKILQHPNLRQ